MLFFAGLAKDMLPPKDIDFMFAFIVILTEYSWFFQNAHSSNWELTQFPSSMVLECGEISKSHYQDPTIPSIKARLKWGCKILPGETKDQCNSATDFPTVAHSFDSLKWVSPASIVELESIWPR